MTDSSLTLEPWNVDPLDVPPETAAQERARFFLRFAILAPSSHNSQPWTFRIDGGVVELRPDPSRWLAIADADRRELHISLGCALENLLVACRRFGHAPRVEFLQHAGGGPMVRVAPGPADRPPSPAHHRLFDAIRERRTSHQDFTGQPLEETLLAAFHEAAEDLDVRLVTIPDGALRASIAELQRRADERQMADGDYREELGEWIGSGVLGDGWPKARIVQWVVTHFDLGGKEGKDNARDLRDAPLVGVLATRDDDAPSRIRVGQAWQRVALAATSAGVATHPLSQILEVPELKGELADRLGFASGVPQHLFRAGFPAKDGAHTPRWPLERFLEG